MSAKQNRVSILRISYHTSHLTDNNTDYKDDEQIKVSLHHIDTRDILARKG